MPRKRRCLKTIFESPEDPESYTRGHNQRNFRKGFARCSRPFTMIDKSKIRPLANPRGMSIKFSMPGGRSTDIVAHSFNGFSTPTSDQFRELLLAISASGPGAAKPSAIDTFLDSHPVAKTFLTTQKTPASFATISYSVKERQ
jgi:hypothetical protein